MTTDAFENIATRLRQQALKAAAAAGADQDTAQDIAQETMLRLWQMRNDPRLYNPEGYASTIARHLTLNQLRRKPALPLDEGKVPMPTVPSPLDLMVQREEEKWLQERIRNLPSTQHAVLHMRQVEHRSSIQIAALLGIKEKSVNTLLARARHGLLEEIRRQRNKDRQ